MLKNRLTTKTVVGVALVAAAAYAVWHFAEIGPKLTIGYAVDDLLKGQQPDKARKRLEQVGDRARVVSALTDALESDKGGVQGKRNVLETLGLMKEARAVRRALDSDVKDTQRAAAFPLQNDEQYAERCRQIALEWIRDRDASDRHLAAQMCVRLKIEEAVPALLEAIEIEPRNPEEQQLVRTALEGLLPYKPEGLGPRMIGLARNPNVAAPVRQAALNSLARYDTSAVDKAEVQALAIRLLEDRGEEQLVRAGCTNVLRSTPYASAESLAALEKVLLDPAEEEIVIQRLCLSALGEHAPLERIEEIVLDRRVYNHPYMGIRVDVATALAAMNVRKRLALDILLEYLVDADKDDKQRVVRREGFLSLYALTGFHRGVKEQRLFQHPPLPIQDPERIREYLFRPAHLRYGITPEQKDAVDKIVRDDAEMKKIRDLARSVMETMIANWAKAAENAAGGATDGASAQGTDEDADDDEKRQSEDGDGPDEPQTPQDD